MNKIKLGCIARDTITGFTGLVTVISKNLNNCDRVSLQPRELNENGSPKDAIFFDVPQLEYIEETDVKVVEPVICTVKQGDQVSHPPTGYSGRVVNIVTYINGCVRVGIQSPKLVKGQPVDDNWFPCQEVELISSCTPSGTIKTGGPMKAPKQMSNPR